MSRYALCAFALALMACGDVVSGSGIDAPPDPCPGAICECTAATEAMDCDAHQVCDESGGNRQCKCAAGYTGGTEGACVFSSPLADPGFQDPARWTVTNGVMVLPAATGSANPGELSFDKMALCNFGSAKQMVTMPPFARADSLRLTVTHTILDPMNDFFVPNKMQISLGGQFMEFFVSRPITGQTHKSNSFCLGPAAFGGPVELSVHSAGNAPCMPASMGSIRIDEVKLEIASPGECPAQAGIVNGNFQLATGWAFPNTNSGQGQIVPNIGENSSFAAQLQQPNRCSEVSAIGTIQIPAEAQVAHPALDVYWNGTTGARLAVSLAGKGIGTLQANGQIRHSRVCIPKWAVGLTTQVGFLAQRISDNNCGVALNRTFILDNITIVDEPACGTLSDVTDPSFERVVNAMGPMPGVSLKSGMVNDIEGSRAFVINQASNARSGTGVLRTHGSNPCVSPGARGAGAEIGFVVPAPSGTAGPAVKYFAKVDSANVNTEAQVQLLSGLEFGQPLARVTVPESAPATYAPGTLCLPPRMAGRLASVLFTSGATGGGSCGPSTFDEFAFFDDISITTDPTCPAQ